MCNTEFVNTISRCSHTTKCHLSTKHDTLIMIDLFNDKATSWWATLSTDRWNSTLSYRKYSDYQSVTV